jgi:uncharacterized protein with FMN-binding domain
MRRAVLILSGTAAGLIALFSYKTHVPGITPVADPSSPAALTSSAPPMPTATKSLSATKSAAARKPTPSATKTTAAPTTAPTTAPASTPPTTIAPASMPTAAATTAAPTPTATKTTAKPTPTPTPTPTTQTITGPDESTNYGDVQVQITVSGGKITAANDVQSPEDSIGSNAVQQLNQEVLTAQSANIQAVSGATYTSQGYIASLQQAVNQAGL